MIPDPAEATAHFDREEVFARIDAMLVEVEVEPSEESAPAPHAGALYALGGSLVGVGLALIVLLALGCGGAVAWAVPVAGGTADEAPASGWCSCP